MHPDSTWQGPISLQELLFGTWLTYILLVVIWEKFLKRPLQEWKYLMLMCMAASFFVINHFFFFAPFYLTVINIYTLMFLVVWYWFGIADSQRSLIWKLGAIVGAVVYSYIYVVFELSVRRLIEAGVHEVWITVMTFLGFAGVILWRREAAKA